MGPCSKCKLYGCCCPPREVVSELRITKAKVIEAAKACPDAKHTLQTLFPEAFQPEAVSTNIAEGTITLPGIGTIQNRTGGKYASKGFYLPEGADNITWRIERDSVRALVLIPERKVV